MELEDKLKELESIAEKLDDKDLPLESAIKLFENGVKLVGDCLKSLNESKGKIEVLRGELKAVMQGGEGVQD